MTSKAPSTFHGRLSEVINERGLTYRQVAAAAKAHPNQVTRWTSGERKPSSQHLMNLADALKLDLNWLLLGRGHSPAEPEREKELARRVTDLAPKLNAVVELARQRAK